MLSEAQLTRPCVPVSSIARGICRTPLRGHLCGPRRAWLSLTRPSLDRRPRLTPTSTDCHSTLAHGTCTVSYTGCYCALVTYADRAFGLLQRRPDLAALAAYPFGFDLERVGHVEEVRLANGAPIEPIAGNDSGGTYFLCARGEVLYADSEGRAGLIADSTDDALALLIGLPSCPRRPGRASRELHRSNIVRCAVASVRLSIAKTVSESPTVRLTDCGERRAAFGRRGGDRRLRTVARERRRER